MTLRSSCIYLAVLPIVEMGSRDRQSRIIFRYTIGPDISGSHIENRTQIYRLKACCPSRLDDMAIERASLSIPTSTCLMRNSFTAVQASRAGNKPIFVETIPVQGVAVDWLLF